jgi:hypothetical protein
MLWYTLLAIGLSVFAVGLYYVFVSIKKNEAQEKSFDALTQEQRQRLREMSEPRPDLPRKRSPMNDMQFAALLKEIFDINLSVDPYVIALTYGSDQKETFEITVSHNLRLLYRATWHRIEGDQYQLLQVDALPVNHNDVSHMKAVILSIVSRDD